MSIITSIRRTIARIRVQRCIRTLEKLTPNARESRLNKPFEGEHLLRRSHHTPVATAGQPLWQAAFNRFCLSDVGLREWVPLLDGYLAAGARGATRNQALVEAAARSVINGGRGYLGGSPVFSGELVDGTFIHREDSGFVPQALADPILRQLVLNFALRNLYMNPELVKALLAEGAEPGGQQVKHAAQDAVDGDDRLLQSLDLLLDAGGDIDRIDHIDHDHWRYLPDWIKAKHGSIVRRDLTMVAFNDVKDFQLEFGSSFNRTPAEQATIDEARRRAVPGRITAEMLNAPLPDQSVRDKGLPRILPMWVHLVAWLPATARPAELERLIARGADVSLAGIARHAIGDARNLVQACFDMLPEVRIHVEGAELRLAIEKATSADPTPVGPARRRL